MNAGAPLTVSFLFSPGPQPMQDRAAAFTVALLTSVELSGSRLRELPQVCLLGTPSRAMMKTAGPAGR